jgi:hypothetical protein
MSTNPSPSLWTTSIANHSPTLIIISTILLLFTTLFFATRLTHHQRGWDDLFATLAYLTLITQTIFGCIAASHGFGKHRVDIPFTSFTQAMLWFWLYQICCKILGGFTKLTFCALYLRIFPPEGKTGIFRRVVWSTAVVTAMGTIAFTLGTVWQCTPVRRAWDRREEGRCTDNLSFWFSHAAFNTFMDVVVSNSLPEINSPLIKLPADFDISQVYILPIPLISTLKITSRTRTGLISVFALGAFVIAASIVRMVMLKGSAEASGDPTWGSMPALTWTEIEANTSVVVCCLPALRVLGGRVWKGVRSRTGEKATEDWSGDGDGGDGGGGPKEDNGTRMGTFSRIRYSPPASPAPAAAHPFKRTRLADASPDHRKQSAFDRMYSTLGLGPSPAGSEESLPPIKLAPKLGWGGAIYKRTEVTVESRRRNSLALGKNEDAKPGDGEPLSFAELMEAEAKRKGY